MLLPMLVALLQTPAPRDARPVRVWLDQSVLARGTSVHVFVQASQDGNLIVLHRRTDGRIEVLFPGSPKDDPYVRAGTYEIQATPDRVAFVVAEPDGSGLVLAALAPTGYRFDEFVHAAAWNPDALAPSWSGSDGEGALSDIVQRMLGDGYFNYDIATYNVAPPVYAMAQDTGVTSPAYPTCTDCTFIGYQENVYEPVALCDAFFSPCLDRRFRHHGRLGDERTSAPVRHTIALSMPAPASASVIPRDPRASGGFVRRPPAPGQPIAFRPRAPLPEPTGRPIRAIRAIPLVPGRRAVARAPAPPDRRRIVSAPAEAGPAQVVRLTLTPHAVREDPDETARSRGTITLTGLAVSRPVALAPVRDDTPERVAPRARAPVAQPEAAASEPPLRTRAMAVAGGNAHAGAEPRSQGQSLALPPAVFQGAQARIPPANTRVRRR